MPGAKLSSFRGFFLLLVAMLWSQGVVGQQPDPTWYEKRTEWNGYDQFHFKVRDRAAYVVAPRKPAEGNPWIWRARFPGYHAEMDVTLLARGYHVAYVDVAGLFGSSRAVAIGDALYDFMTANRELSPKVCLEGVSRGGLMVYNWAAGNTDKVASIYCDTPVCDICSWPGGKGSGIGAPKAWEQCLSVHGLSEQHARDFDGNPLDHAEAIAKAKIPILHIVSENDRVVPPEENTYRLKGLLQQYGHDMEIISVAEGTSKSNGHHFDHPDPQRVVDFVTRNTTQIIRVACVGDSITAGARVDAKTESYPSRLQVVLGDQYQVENFGVGGATLIRTGRPNVWQKLDAVKAFAPHIVVVSLGTNDTVGGKRRNWEKIERFERDYAELINSLAGLSTKPQIVLCTPTSMVLTTKGLKPDRLANLEERKPRLQQLCERIRNIATSHAEKNVSLLELNEVLRQRPELLTPSDGVHPNREGYAAIAKAVAEHIAGLD